MLRRWPRQFRSTNYRSHLFSSRTRIWEPFRTSVVTSMAKLTWADPLATTRSTQSRPMEITVASMRRSIRISNLIFWRSMSSVDAPRTSKKPPSKPKWLQFSWISVRCQQQIETECISSSNYRHSSIQPKISTVWMESLWMRSKMGINAWLKLYLYLSCNKWSLMTILPTKIRWLEIFSLKIMTSLRIRISLHQLMIWDTNSGRTSTTTKLIGAPTQPTTLWNNIKTTSSPMYQNRNIWIKVA